MAASQQATSLKTCRTLLEWDLLFQLSELLAKLAATLSSSAHMRKDRRSDDGFICI